MAEQNNQAPAGGDGRRLGVLLALILLALLLGIWQPVPLETILGWGSWVASQPLAVVAIILLQAALFSFALPGSLLVWAIAPFLPPLLAVPILVTGSVLGALGAYAVSRRLGGDWRPRRGAWLIDLVARRGDFLTQCALRVLPGCPHWTVSYAGGVVGLPLPTFILAAILGLTVKWWVYASAIHGVGTAAEAEGAIGPGLVLPLVILTGFLLVGGIFRRRLVKKVAPRDRDDTTGSARD